MFAFTAIPSGWLECDGSEVSRTEYAALFAKIGTTNGAGDGSTTFNLPETRGEYVRGFDNGRGVDSGRVLGTWQDGEAARIASVQALGSQRFAAGNYLAANSVGDSNYHPGPPGVHTAGTNTVRNTVFVFAISTSGI